MKKAKATNPTSVAPATETSTNIQERDTVTLDLLNGSEPSIGVETPNFSAMTETQFHLTMVKATDKANEYAEQHGLAIYQIILPGLEFAKAQFAEGKTVNGCTGIEAYIKSLGLQPPTIRKWRERAANRDLLKKINQLTFMPHIDDMVTTPDGNLAKVIDLTADKADVEEMLPNAHQPVIKTYERDQLTAWNSKPFYCAKTVHNWDVDVAASAAQKAVRDGDEGNGCYWILELYWTNDQKLSPIDIWKKLGGFYGEEVALADLSLSDEIIELERKAYEALKKEDERLKRYLENFEHLAEKVKDGRNSDLLYVINAMMLLCRAKKSRAADNAILWFKENPTYVPPTPEEIKHYAFDDLPTPVIPDKVYDQHTAKGRKMKRGLDHFLKEAAVLTNESDVAPFQPPVTVADPEKPFPTESGV